MEYIEIITVEEIKIGWKLSADKAFIKTDLILYVIG